VPAGGGRGGRRWRAHALWGQARAAGAGPGVTQPERLACSPCGTVARACAGSAGVARRRRRASDPCTFPAAAGRAGARLGSESQNWAGPVNGPGSGRRRLRPRPAGGPDDRDRDPTGQPGSVPARASISDPRDRPSLLGVRLGEGGGRQKADGRRPPQSAAAPGPGLAAALNAAAADSARTRDSGGPGPVAGCGAARAWWRSRPAGGHLPRRPVCGMYLRHSGRVWS
jgi:hypothetical protein